MIDRARPGRKRKLDERAGAHLVAIACSDLPKGNTHWTLKLPEDKAVELGYVESIARETVRQSLKNELKPSRNKAWRISELSGEFVAGMEDALNFDSHRGYTY